MIFLFTPISLHQVGQKIENFINNRAIAGVEQFEKQTGLKIQWSALDFNIFIMTVRLEDVQVLYLKESRLKKIEELEFLYGSQKIKKISARPSLYSLLFDKEIILSKLSINGGDISLRTLKNLKTNIGNSNKNVKLPIEKILIKNTNISLRHKNQILQFSNIKAVVLQKINRAFNFNFTVESFYLSNSSNLTTIFNIKPSKIDRSNLYQLSLKGIVQQDQISFSQVNIKNDLFSSLTKALKIYFKNESFYGLDIVSSGSLPLSLLEWGCSLVDKELPFSNSYLSYDLNLKYKKNEGYRGNFSVSSKDLFFRAEKLKSFNLKGSLNKSFLSINRGFIETKKQGSFYIKSIKWFFLEKAKPFNISIETEKLFSGFITRTILNGAYIPIMGDLTGSVSCQGKGQSVEYLQCQLKGKSQQIKLQLKDQDSIFSLYDMTLDSTLKWEDQSLTFALNGLKEHSAKINFKGNYSLLLNEFSASYSFSGQLNENLQFNTPFLLKGKAEFLNGRVSIKSNKVELSGRLSSPALSINTYQLGNVSSSYSFKNNTLNFINIQGRQGQTSYLAQVSVDFKKKVLGIKLDSSFFNIQDFLVAIKNKITFPLDLKGSGAVSFFLYWPWRQTAQKEFQLNGEFFNVFIGKDFFSQSVFDFNFKNQQGVVQSLLLKKGPGLIEGSGFFDENYKLSLTMTGKKLPLENIDLFNSLLPFNQSGDVHFNAKIEGSLNDPVATGEAIVSNTFFYSYPVKDSFLKFRMDKSALSFSGNIINEINIDQFLYPFSKKSNFKVTGHFSNFDIIKILFSKNKKDKNQNYISQLKGSFVLEKENASSFWSGG
ncbi:MAG: hypothetical protein OXN83_01245, partial [Oligoflexia bacterium]|nr:hypothetical protein [Oligoflexia bacterium]